MLVPIGQHPKSMNLCLTELQSNLICIAKQHIYWLTFATIKVISLQRTTTKTKHQHLLITAPHLTFFIINNIQCATGSMVRRFICDYSNQPRLET